MEHIAMKINDFCVLLKTYLSYQWKTREEKCAWLEEYGAQLDWRKKNIPTNKFAINTNYIAFELEIQITVDAIFDNKNWMWKSYYFRKYP